MSVTDPLHHGELVAPVAPTNFGRLLPPLLAAGLCVLVGLGMLGALGYPMREVLGTVWEKVIWPVSAERRLANWGYVLQFATPILLTGLAIMVAFRAALWNIGAQGQLLAGAIAATALGVHLGGWSAVTIPLVLMAGAGAGAVLGAMAALLEWWRRVPVVLSTLLLNFTVVELLRFLLQGPMREPGGQVKSEALLEVNRLPMIAGTGLHVGFLVALAMAPVVALLIRSTTFGFRLRVVGENPVAARFAGMHVPRVALATLALSGALAGLAGAIEVAGVTHELHQTANESGFGFTGIAVALLGRLTASGVVAAALFFGLLNASFRALQAEMDVPFVTGQALQGLIVILMLVLSHPKALAVLGRLRRVPPAAAATQ